jgi:hypothetical protein
LLLRQEPFTQPDRGPVDVHTHKLRRGWEKMRLKEPQDMALGTANFENTRDVPLDIDLLLFELFFQILEQPA